MTKFCIVAPIQVLEGLERAQEVGLNHLVLAHDIVKHPERYHDVFEPISKFHHRIVILDSGVIETGLNPHLEVMLAACREVIPTFVVLPDILLDSKATIASCSTALKEWPGKFPIKTQFMLIPQGKTIEEFTECAEYFTNGPIAAWGCPRNLVKQIGTRERANQILHTLNPTRPIHMMGFSDSIYDDILSAKYCGLPIMSIDSAVPLRYPSRIQLTTKPGPRDDTWWRHGMVTDQTIGNLKIVRDWLA